MLKKNIYFIIVLLFTLMIVGCEDYVQNFEKSITSAIDEDLNTPDEITFLTRGVQFYFANTLDVLVVLSDGLSDALFFSRAVPRATYPTFEQIDLCDISYDNNSVDGLFNNIYRLMYHADDLLDRIDTRMTFQDATDSSNADYGRLIANFYGGIARFWLAEYFAISPDTAGAPINNGPFVTQAELLNRAVAKFNEALNYVGSDPVYEKYINTMLAKIEILRGNLAGAKTYLDNGLMQGDEPLQGKYNTVSDNYVWQQAGRLRMQWAVDPRFANYIINDPKEAERIPLEGILGRDGNVYYRQIKYKEDSDPINYLTWQENYLMLAEYELLVNNDAAAALNYINEVRRSHNLSDLANVDQNVLIEERDKELFLTGNRLLDQRRFNLPFYTPSAPSVGPWRYFPVTQGERNANPNVN